MSANANHQRYGKGIDAETFWDGPGARGKVPEFLIVFCLLFLF